MALPTCQYPAPFMLRSHKPQPTPPYPYTPPPLPPHSLDRLAAKSEGGELAALKARLRDAVTALESPNLQQLTHIMRLGGAGEGGAGGGSRGGTPGRRRGGGGVATEEQLDRRAVYGGGDTAVGGEEGEGEGEGEGGGSDPFASALLAALDGAVGSCSAALHHVGLLQVAHWEAEGGVEAVGEMRGHLLGAAAEMAAGR